MFGFLPRMAGTVLLGLCLAGAACGASRAADLNAQILEELNFARTQPQAYALWLMTQPVSDWERRLSPASRAQDPEAFAEAVDFLIAQPPLAPLAPDDILAKAALEHVADQGHRGAIGHESADGERFDRRLRRNGLKSAWAAENISYGPPTAQDVVRELIVDAGVADRGHRRNIFHPMLAQAGVNCGAHAAYGVMCVIDFSGAPKAADPATAPLQVAQASPPRGLLARLFGALP